jgi:ABC-type phosphate/phosphonate transport system ATPase subunit
LVLTGVNLVIPKGALVMVVGKTGAGKSSLLAAMLGEVEAVAADAYNNNNNNNSSSRGPASKPLSSSRRSVDVAGAAPGGPLVCLEGRVAYTAQVRSCCSPC